MSVSTNTSNTTVTNNLRLPLATTLAQACRLAIVEDKSIYLDYWNGSLEKNAIIGVKGDNTKMLVKSESEYTSNIIKLYKVQDDFIVITENSIYLVDAKIPTKKISEEE